MSLSPFGRRGGFYDAHSEVNRLLDEMFGGLGRRPGSRGAQATAEWAPSVDVLHKDRDLVVRVEMPGVKPEDVHVAGHNRVLTAPGARKVDEGEERGGGGWGRDARREARGRTRRGSQSGPDRVRRA